MSESDAMYLKTSADAPTLSRELPREEFERLRGLGFFETYPLPQASRMRVWVVEREGAIIAYWCLLSVLHSEPIWIDPAVRQTQVLRSLVHGLITLAHDEGVHGVMSIIDDPAVKTMATDLGFERVGEAYTLMLGPLSATAPSPPPEGS